MNWFKEQIDCLRAFLHTDFLYILLFCTVGLAASIVVGAVIGYIMPDMVETIFENFMRQVQDAGVMDESGKLSVFSLLLNNWRAMLTSAIYGFIPFLFLPVISLFTNGALLGMLAMFYHVNGISLVVFLAGILPHGIFELPALVISIACGIYLCRNMCRMITGSPNREPLVELCSDLLRVLLLIVMPLVAAAAVIECYITPLVMGLFM